MVSQMISDDFRKERHRHVLGVPGGAGLVFVWELNLSKAASLG